MPTAPPASPAVLRRLARFPGSGRRRAARALGALGVSLVCGAGAGCAWWGDQTPRADLRPAPTLEQAEVLNIQVFRNVTDLELTNTTARSFGPSTLWINERFGHQIDGLALGESLDIPLDEFVDEFGDTFRAGGFFATREPDPVVLAQLEHDGRLYGLLIGGNRVK